MRIWGNDAIKLNGADMAGIDRVKVSDYDL